METFMSRRQSPSPHSLHWARDFATRQATSYHGQDNRLKIAANGSILDEFFNSCNVDLSPPQRHELLKRFLNSAGARSFPEAAKSGPRDKRVLAIVDDRCDPFTQFTNTPGSTGFLPVRQWESEEYMRRPPEGLHVRIAGGDADMLFYHLNKDRKGVAERRIVYLADLTPLMGLALVSNVSYVQLPQVRSYLSRYVAFDAYMGVSQQRGFTLEFHLPHYVLRPDRPELRDGRGLRKSRSFLPPSSGSNDRIYEAQLSLVVIGVDEFFWMAYFSEDSYFRNSNQISEYLQDKTDGPSFGLRLCKFPIWDPRYYFLSILSIRMGQVTMEWRVLVETIEGRLDRHVRIFRPPSMIVACICWAKARQGEIDEDNLDEFLEDDPSLQKTKEFTWILCTLRRLRNSLARLIASWAAFDRNNSVYFDLDSDGALAAKFRECFFSVRQSTAELNTLQMVLEQRIETMEKMASVLVNASSLAESITATRQGDNIRLLTYITILYLPVTLVTSAFSMNQVSNDIAWWKYWVSLFCLTSATVAVAVGLHLMVHQMRNSNIRSMLGYTR